MNILSGNKCIQFLELYYPQMHRLYPIIEQSETDDAKSLGFEVLTCTRYPSPSVCATWNRVM